MSQDTDKLHRELKFIEESFKSNIITKKEYESAKKRINDKLSIISEEPEPEVPEPDVPEPEVPEQSKLETYNQEEPFYKEEISEKSLPDKPDKEDRLKLETYGKPRKKSRFLIYLAIVLFIIIIFFTINFRNPDSIDVPDIPADFVAVCSADLDCRQTGKVGECLNPGTKDAECSFKDAVELGVTIVTDEDCVVCDIGRMQNTIKQIYPGANFKILDSSNADEFISFIDVLPAYIFDVKVEGTHRFDNTVSALTKTGDYYFMKPTATGAPYFFKKPEVNKKVDLYIDSSSETSAKAFNNLLELSEKYNFDYDIYYVKGEPMDICVREFSEQRHKLYLQCVFDPSNGEREECVEDLAITDTECNSDRLFSIDERKADSFSINVAPVFIVNNQYKKGGSLSVDLLEEFYCKINKC